MLKSPLSVLCLVLLSGLLGKLAYAVPVTYNLSATFSTGQAGYYPNVYGTPVAAGNIVGTGFITFESGETPDFKPNDIISGTKRATQYLSVILVSDVTDFSFSIGNVEWKPESTVLLSTQPSNLPPAFYFAADTAAFPPDVAEIGLAARNALGDVIYFDRMGCGLQTCTLGAQATLVDLHNSTINMTASSTSATVKASLLPEPGSALLLAGGLIGLSAVQRRARNR